MPVNGVANNANASPFVASIFCTIRRYRVVKSVLLVAGAAGEFFVPAIPNPLSIVSILPVMAVRFVEYCTQLKACAAVQVAPVNVQS